VDDEQIAINIPDRVISLSEETILGQDLFVSPGLELIMRGCYHTGADKFWIVFFDREQWGMTSASYLEKPGRFVCPYR